MSGDDDPGEETFTLPAQLPTYGEAGEPDLPTPRFVLGELVGSGGMADVFAAEDTLLSRSVALKVLRAAADAQPELRRRLVQEARAAVALRHPNIVEVSDVDPSGRFIVMELISGQSLEQRLTRGRLTLAELLELSRAILSALVAAHASGIIHRDIKPSNILITEEGRYKLSDFGVAHLPDSELTLSGVIVGTPKYMAPEQLRGHKSDAQSDLYSLGATLFEAATGQRLHGQVQRPEIARLVRAVTGHVSLSRLVAQLLAELPAERPASAASALQALEQGEGLRVGRGLFGGLLLGVAALGMGVWLVSSGGPLREESAREQGIALLKRHQISEADLRLKVALEQDPTDAVARYYYALARFWLGRPLDEVSEQIRMVKPGALEPWRYEVLAGIRLVAAEELPAAIEHFRRLERQQPSEVQVLYGLFEALFHGGRAAEAIPVYRRILELDPTFDLGAMHALDYLISRGEDPDWVLRTTPPETRGLWSARALIAQGRLAEAIALLGPLRDEATPDSVLPLELERAHALAVQGDLEAAEQEVKRIGTRSANVARVEELLLAVARGSTMADALRERYWRELIVPQSGFARINRIAELASLEAMRLDEIGARELIPELEASKSLRSEAALVFVAARLRDRALLGRLEGSIHPEVQKLAAALVAEQEGRWDEAARLATDALEASSNGEFRIPEWFVLARIAHRRGDLVNLRLACAEVLRPRQFRPAWAVTARQCRGWLAEAPG